jgi:hypothetical protein
MESPWRRVEREWRRTGNGAAKILVQFTVAVAADDLTEIARSGYPEVQSADENSPSRRSASSSATPLLPRS